MRLDPLFRPESIAVIGASDKSTPGRRIIASLERIGFAGRIFPVNPNYPSVLNRPCYASPAELPEAPDIAVFCLGHERVFSAFEAAAKRGMKAAVIYRRKSRRDRMCAKLREIKEGLRHRMHRP